jgi:hypothetical protein
MPTYIRTPADIPAAGSKPKLIEEYVGRVNTPEAEGAEYIAICLPAFSSATVRRDE